MAVATQSIVEGLRHMTPVAAPAQERDQVTALAAALARMIQERPAALCKLTGPRGEEIAVPESVFHVLERVAEVMARGDSITVVPVGKELTSQQAALLLNVSRQYLVRLLDGGRMPYRRTGKHRRLRIEDVLRFREDRDRRRRAALRELSELTEEAGGYEAERKAK